MARDSSPFAKRLKKAISQRPAGQAQDADPSAQEQPAVEPLAPMEVQPQSGAAPDEQPTGEFPAIEATDVVGGPVPDRPVQPYGQASAAHVADDEQPTGDVPAVEPGWLDPPAADPITPASIIGVDQTGAPEGDSAHRVDWSPPADDVFEPTPAPPAESSGPVSPYLPDPPAPIWETEAAEASSSSDAPLPIWESIDTPAEGATPAQAPSTDDTTPAWAQEAEAIGESSGPVVPPPLSGYDAPTASPAASTAPDGPTLSPPVLPKKTHPEDAPSAIEPAEDASPTEAPGDQSGEADIAATVTSSVDSSTDEAAPTAQTEDAPSTRDAHEAALAALPDESEPEWTPTALHEALSLDEDEADDAPKSAATSDDSTADADSASTADEAEAEPTPVEEPTPAPAAKRGLRSPFGRRKRETSAAATTDALPSGVADTDEAAPAPTPEPETSIHAAVPAPAEDTTVDERNAESDVDPVASTTSADEPEQNATDSTVDGPDEPSVDPGSITSRFAAIGRRALSRKEAKAAAAAAAAQAAGDADDHSATPPGAVPESETAPVAVPAEQTVSLADYKPTFSERAALRRRVKSLRARRDAGLAELGAIVLDQSRFGDPTGGTLVRRRTTLLADLDSEIAAIEAALDESGPPEAVAQLGVVHCASCSALVGPADQFCAACGTARPAADAGAAPSAA